MSRIDKNKKEQKEKRPDPKGLDLDMSNFGLGEEGREAGVGLEAFEILKGSDSEELVSLMERYRPKLGMLKKLGKNIKGRDFQMFVSKVKSIGGVDDDISMLIGLCIDLYVSDNLKPSVNNLGGPVTGKKILKLMFDCGLLGKGGFTVKRMALLYPEDVLIARKEDPLRANQWCYLYAKGATVTWNFAVVMVEGGKLSVKGLEKAKDKSKILETNYFAPSNLLLTPEGDSEIYLNKKWRFANRVYSRLMISLQDQGLEKRSASDPSKKYEKGKGLSKLNTTWEEMAALREAKFEVKAELHAKWFAADLKEDIKMVSKGERQEGERNLFPFIKENRDVSFSKGKYLFVVRQNNDVIVNKMESMK